LGNFDWLYHALPRYRLYRTSERPEGARVREVTHEFEFEYLLSGLRSSNSADRS
jgi:hypothetical protein